MKSHGTRAEVLRLAEESAHLRDNLGGLLRSVQRKWRPPRGRLAMGAVAVLGLAGTALGVRAVRRRSLRRRRRELTSPIRRRVRWAIAAGVLSLLARRFARRALAP